MSSHCAHGSTEFCEACNLDVLINRIGAPWDTQPLRDAIATLRADLASAAHDERQSAKSRPRSASDDTRVTSREEMHRVKCWIDLNCPLWPDYIQRDLRPGPPKQTARAQP